MQRILPFIIVLMLSTAASAQPLEIENPVRDVMRVKAGAALRETFLLRNTSAEPLTITDVAVACGCLRPTITQKLLQPGQQAELILEVNTLSQPAGSQSWKATVTHARGAVELVIKAIIVREISLEPVALALTIDKAATASLTLADSRDKSLSIVAVRTSREQLTASARRSATGFDIEVTVTDIYPVGHFTETLSIVTDDPEYRELRVPITINKRGRDAVQAAPAELDLRLAKGQTAASGLVRLRDPDDRQIVVDRLEADHPAVRTRSAVGPGSMATLRLSIEGATASGQSLVRVHLSQPTKQIIAIPVRWQVP